MSFTEYIILCFPAVFVILNPFSAASSFLSLTSGQSEEQQVSVAQRACITSFVVLMLFAFAGHFIFQVFQITISAFRIAGGIILFGIGLEMLKLRPNRIKQTEEEMKEGMGKEDVAIVPLGIPLLSGPGAITTIMVLTAEISWKNKWSGLLQMGGLIVSCALSLVIIYFILVNSKRLLDLFKITGVGLITRIMGLILSVIATQFVISGVKDLLPEFAKLVQH
ncbi:MAG: NAAT family transporter [Deltaproteobacteria bacterium]|nr:NAAT family transporter [Deltaproteobacteria bacterium]